LEKTGAKRRIAGERQAILRAERTPESYNRMEKLLA
jgi:hypothetical protein